MKQLYLLPIFLLFFFLKTNAQNSRWMFLSSNKDVTYMVDTSKNDIKQLDFYDGHKNIVLIWIKSLQNKVDNAGSFVEATLIHFAVDTTTSELGSKSIAIYRDDSVVKSHNSAFVTWEDVLPGSNGEVFVDYCRALNNKAAMLKYVLGAIDHEIQMLPKKN